MTVDEVIRLLGKPEVIYDDEGVATLVYYLSLRSVHKRKLTKKHLENLRLGRLRYYERKRRERSLTEKKKE